MAAPRTSSFKALRLLSAHSRQTVQSRKLHMTPPSTFPSPLLTSERPAVNLPKDFAGLQAECRKRNLPVSGSKQELADRLHADATIQSRSFTSAIERDQKRPAASEADAFMAIPPVRHFNTSRELKAVNDSSTIDFAYFPDFDPDSEAPPPVERVPLIPQSISSYHAESYEKPQKEDETFMRQRIVLASADSTYISSPSAMSDLHDNNAIDIGEMAQKVAQAAKDAARASPVQFDEQANTISRLWSGFLDDVLGPKQIVKAT